VHEGRARLLAHRLGGADETDPERGADGHAACGADPGVVDGVLEEEEGAEDERAGADAREPGERDLLLERDRRGRAAVARRLGARRRLLAGARGGGACAAGSAAAGSVRAAWR
jgi:hypothetical protein